MGVGACRTGTGVCDKAGAVLECVGEVTPRAEMCNAVDDDCDGEVDGAGLVIPPNDPDNRCKQCGACEFTYERCTDGTWFCDYRNGTPPDRESRCDGQDEDCDCRRDEKIDLYPDGEVIFCYTGPTASVVNGTCRPGVEACIDGQTVCDGEVLPQPFEMCDGEDEDCNGLVDDVDSLFDSVDIILAIDVSGSMTQYIEEVASVVCDYADASVGQDTAYSFGLVLIASPDGSFTLVQNLADAATLCIVLGSLQTPGGDEPTLDAANAVTSPFNPLSIDWRLDSKRIFIGFGDEAAQAIACEPSNDICLAQAAGYAVDNCEVTDTSVYWFVTMPEHYTTQTDGCGGEVFWLTTFEEMMLEDMNSIIASVCLGAP